MGDSDSPPRYVGTQALYVVAFLNEDGERIASLINNDHLPVPDIGEQITLQEIEFEPENVEDEGIIEDCEVIERSFEYRYVTDDSDVVDKSDKNLENAVIHHSTITVKPL